jgi:hypothetical protein
MKRQIDKTQNAYARLNQEMILAEALKNDIERI